MAEHYLHISCSNGICVLKLLMGLIQDPFKLFKLITLHMYRVFHSLTEDNTHKSRWGKILITPEMSSHALHKLQNWKNFTYILQNTVQKFSDNHEKLPPSMQRVLR